MDSSDLERPDTTAREAGRSDRCYHRKRWIGTARDVNDARSDSAGSSFRSGQGLVVTACDCMVCGAALRPCLWMAPAGSGAADGPSMATRCRWRSPSSRAAAASPRSSRPGIWQPDFIESDELPVLSVVYVARLVGRSSPGIDVANVGWFLREAILRPQIGFASMRRTLRDYVRRRQ